MFITQSVLTAAERAQSELPMAYYGRTYAEREEHHVGTGFKAICVLDGVRLYA